MKKLPCFYCSTFFLTLQNLKTFERYRNVLLLLIGWVLVFPCSCKRVFFCLQNFKSYWKSYSECCNLHSNLGANYSFSFFHTHGSFSQLPLQHIISTFVCSQLRAPLPVCSNCRNWICAVGLCLRWRYWSSITHTHTHSYLSLLPLKGRNRSRYKSSYMQISVVRGDESYSSRNRIDIYAYIRSKPHLGWLRQICVATIGMTFSSTREKGYGSILVALKCVPGN